MSGFVRNPVTGIPDFMGRYIKPSFKYQSAKSVVVPASDTRPAYFVIGGNVYRTTSDLECNVGAVEGGIAANTVYYLYAYLLNDEVTLVADLDSPETGPKVQGEWTYIGAVATVSSSAIINPFQSVRGHTQFIREIATATDPSSTAATLWTITSLPVTAKMALFQLTLAGTGAGEAAYISSTSDSLDAAGIALQVNSIYTYSWAWVPILTEKSVWMIVTNTSLTFTPEFYGWIEDPSEYQ